MAAFMIAMPRSKIVKSTFKLGYTILTQSNKLARFSQCREFGHLTGYYSFLIHALGVAWTRVLISRKLN